MNLRIRSLGLAAAIFLAHPLFAAPGFTVSGFTLNPGLIIEMAKQAQQTTGTLTEYPAGLNPNILGLMVTNTDTVPAYAYIRIYINDAGNGTQCASNNNQIVSGCPIRTKVMLQPGVPTHLDASSFTTNMGTGISFSGNFCQQFVTDEQNQLGVNNNNNGSNNTPSNAAIQSEVQRLMTHQFQVCVDVVDQSCPTTKPYGTSCTNFTLLLGSPGAGTVPALPLNPIDREISGSLIFLWIPGHGSDPSPVRHRLEITDGFDSTSPLVTKEFAPGIASYTWQASDFGFEAGKQYYWAIVALASDGTPLGRSVPIKKWFRLAKVVGGVLGASGGNSSIGQSGDPSQVWSYIKSRLSPGLLKKLTGKSASSATVLSGPLSLTELYAKLNSGTWTVQSVELSKE
jgi:hypothetical protein